MPINNQLPEGVPPLSTYYMYITKGCNLACRHCWISPTFEQNGSTGECFLDFNLYKLAIEEALPLGLSRIKFTGGEPLLHPDFYSMVEYATEKGLKTWMETNGTLITPKLARNLKEKTSLHTVSVSLDGATVATHDSIRNVPGSFEKARRGVNYLAEAGYNPQIIMGLFPGNLAEIEPLIQWAEKAHCSSIKFNIVQSSGRGELLKEQNELIPIEELMRLGFWIEKDLQKKYPIRLHFSWPIAFHGIKRLQNDLGSTCNIFSILGILSSGDLAMCGIGTQEKDLIYGRLGRDKVGEIWSSNSSLKKLRESIPDNLEGVCSKCIFKNRCIGSCIAQNFYAQKSLTAPFWFCHQADEKGFFPEHRCRIARDL